MKTQTQLKPNCIKLVCSTFRGLVSSGVVGCEWEVNYGIGVKTFPPVICPHSKLICFKNGQNALNYFDNQVHFLHHEWYLAYAENLVKSTKTKFPFNMLINYTDMIDFWSGKLKFNTSSDKYAENTYYADSITLLEFISHEDLRGKYNTELS